MCWGRTKVLRRLPEIALLLLGWINGLGGLHPSWAGIHSGRKFRRRGIQHTIGSLHEEPGPQGVTMTQHFGFVRWAGLFWLCLLVGGCGNIGPKTIPRDRFDYADAIATSWKDQMLLNMVRLRYADVPVFLEIGSIINQYTVEGEVSAEADIISGAGVESGTVGATGRYVNRPTITYDLLRGDEFARSLLRPIPPDTVFSLIQAGWPVDFVLGIGVRSLNGVPNTSATLAPGQAADNRFQVLLGAMRRIQDSGTIGVRVERESGSDASVLFFSRGDTGPIADDRRLVREILGLDSARGEYKLVFGTLPRTAQEIAVLSRSMLEILVELGAQIAVPSQHVAQRRVAETTRVATTIGDYPLIRVQSAAVQPTDAFVAVRYRNYWYWIDDRDYSSKRMFTLLMILFSVAETGTPGNAPVITVPAG